MLTELDALRTIAVQANTLRVMQDALAAHQQEIQQLRAALDAKNAGTKISTPYANTTHNTGEGG